MNRLRAAFVSSLIGLLFSLMVGGVSAQDIILNIGTNPELGSIVVAANGLTLYTFANDTAGVSTCNAGCIESWPAYVVDGNADLTAIAPGIEGTVATITREDGTTQVTLNNQPLYFFITDTEPGSANGEGAGGVWFVIKVDVPADEAAPTEEAAAPEPTTEPETPVENSATDNSAVNTASSDTLGVFLTAANGMTLYTFANDTAGTSNCVAQCAELWPPYIVEDTAGFPVFVDSIGGTLGVIENPAGGSQLTLNDQPLYFYFEDVQPGDTTGQGVGSVWFVVNLELLHTAANAELGNLLVAGNGMTLYTFANDTAGTSNCVAQCAELWPPLTAASADAVPAVAGGVTGEFATIEREDGSFQVTRNDQPLYFFSTDEKPGDTNGNGVGSVWFALSLDTIRVVNNPTLGTLLATSGGLTLYTFANDEPGWSNCVGDCEANWPAFTVEDENSILVTASLASALATSQRADGGLQVTFNNRPLYTFVGDEKLGDTNGEGLGGVWSAAKVAQLLQVGGNADLGAFVVGSDGMTLYTFANDTAGTSNCQGGCAETWPPLLAEAGQTPVAGGGIAGALGTIDRGDGSLQVTLDGKPVYYFSNDTVPGTANGQGAGGVWYVIELDVPFDVSTLPVTCTVTPVSNGVNLRAGAGTGFDVAGTVNASDTLTAVGQATDSSGFVWYQLNTGSFIRSDVVTADPGCAALPTVSA